MLRIREEEHHPKRGKGRRLPNRSMVARSPQGERATGEGDDNGRRRGVFLAGCGRTEEQRKAVPHLSDLSLT